MHNKSCGFTQHHCSIAEAKGSVLHGMEGYIFKYALPLRFPVGRESRTLDFAKAYELK